MNRNDYLKKLSGYLSKMSKAELEDIMRDFEEYFEFAARDGDDEQTICERLGDPKKIAKEFFAQKYIEEANKEKTFKTMSKAFVSSAGLSILNLLYMLCVVVVGYIAIAGLYITVCSVGLAAIAVIVSTLIFVGVLGAIPVLLFLFTSIGLLALSILGFIGIMQTAKQFRRGNMYFLNKSSREMKRGSYHE